MKHRRVLFEASTNDIASVADSIVDGLSDGARAAILGFNEYLIGSIPLRNAEEWSNHDASAAEWCAGGNGRL